MYLSFYGLKQYPFQSNPNPEYFWQGRTISELLLLLQDNILEDRGIFLLTGDIGTGKTTVAARLTQILDNRVVVGTIVDPGLSMLDFLNHIAHAFNLRQTFKSKETFYIHFKHYLTTVASTGRNVLLIIDEAQSLTQDKFAEIESLLKGEKRYARTIKFLLVGQNSLHERMQRPGLPGIEEQIAITASYNLAPLSLSETIDYIQNNLKHAGAAPNIFSPEVMRAVYLSSGGIIRQINVICDHAMLAAFLKEEKQITTEMIAETAAHLALPAEIPEEKIWQEGITPPPPADNPKMGFASTWPRVAATLTAALLGGFFLYTQLPRVSADPTASSQSSSPNKQIHAEQILEENIQVPVTTVGQSMPAKPSVIAISQPAIVIAEAEDSAAPAHQKDTPVEIATATKGPADATPLELPQTGELELPSPRPEIVVVETAEQPLPQPAAKPSEENIVQTEAQPEIIAKDNSPVISVQVAGVGQENKMVEELTKISEGQTVPAQQEEISTPAPSTIPEKLVPEEIQLAAKGKASNVEPKTVVATDIAKEELDSDISTFLDNLPSPAAGPPPQDAAPEETVTEDSVTEENYEPVPPETPQSIAPSTETDIKTLQPIQEEQALDTQDNKEITEPQEETNKPRQQIDQQVAEVVMPSPPPTPPPSQAIAVSTHPVQPQEKTEVKPTVKTQSSAKKRSTPRSSQEEVDPGAIIDWLLTKRGK